MGAGSVSLLQQTATIITHYLKYGNHRLPQKHKLSPEPPVSVYRGISRPVGVSQHYNAHRVRGHCLPRSPLCFDVRGKPLTLWHVSKCRGDPDDLHKHDKSTSSAPRGVRGIIPKGANLSSIIDRKSHWATLTIMLRTSTHCSPLSYELSGCIECHVAE